MVPWSHQTATTELCHSHGATREPLQGKPAATWMQGPQGKARQVKKEQWKGLRDFGTPHKAGEEKKAKEMERWGDASGQMEQQRGRRLFSERPDNH